MQNIMYSLYDVTGIFNIGKAFICIIMLPIIYKAEDIVKTIFGLESKNLAGAAAMGLMVLHTAQKATKLAAKGADKLKKAQDAKKVGRASGTVGGNTNSAPTDPQTSNVANNNMTASDSSKDSNLKKGAKKVGEFAKGKGPIANKLASNAMGMALGYGLTGDYDTARAGRLAQEGIRDAGKGLYGSAKLSTNLAQKNEDMLDAYERLKDNGYTDEQIYHLTEDVLEDDGKELANDLERQYADTIKSVKDTQIAISDKGSDEAEKGAKEYVLEKIQNHILK